MSRTNLQEYSVESGTDLLTMTPVEQSTPGRVWRVYLPQEVAIANRCQPQGAQRTGVQGPLLLQSNEKVLT